MAKSIKLKNNTYLDSSGINHNKKTLNTIIEDVEGKITSINDYLDGLIKIVDIATSKQNMTEGGRYRGSVNVTLPTGYQVISVMPCYTSYGDRNFVDFNLYHEVPRIYYEVYCQYGWGEAMNTNFRVVMIKKNK